MSKDCLSSGCISSRLNYASAGLRPNWRGTLLHDRASIFPHNSAAAVRERRTAVGVACATWRISEGNSRHNARCCALLAAGAIQNRQEGGWTEPSLGHFGATSLQRKNITRWPSQRHIAVRE
jgi:hypothetical protein